MFPNSYGYCDLNISADSSNLKGLVLRALSLGYDTVAINTTINDATYQETKTKGRKGLWTFQQKI